MISFTIKSIKQEIFNLSSFDHLDGLIDRAFVALHAVGRGSSPGHERSKSLTLTAPLKRSATVVRGPQRLPYKRKSRDTV